MSVRPADRAIIDAYFRAMRARGTAEEAMMALFADDAVYVEPFSRGEKRSHVGKPAIRAFMKEAWTHQPPDMTVEVDRIDVDGDDVRAYWTCSAPVFAAPMRGYDVYTIRDGRITRLETTLTPR